MKIELSITRSIMRGLAAHGCTTFARWRRQVARRRLRQLRARRPSLA